MKTIFQGICAGIITRCFLHSKFNSTEVDTGGVGVSPLLRVLRRRVKVGVDLPECSFLMCILDRNDLLWLYPAEQSGHFRVLIIREGLLLRS